MRKAISLGGNSGTLACVTRGIAQAFYGGVPDLIAKEVLDILDEHLGKITWKFLASYDDHPVHLTFAKQNKGAIITEPMRKAVEEVKRQKQREAACRIVTARRSKRPSATDEEIRAAWEEGRP